MTSNRQLSLFHEVKPVISSYDHTIIAFSGGKDSLACFLWAIENKAPNIELWHHDVDGREGSTLMDWPCTQSYCRAIALAFNCPIYFSWLEGGFERELTREDQPKAQTWFETPTGLASAGGKSEKLSTRRRFPQVSGDLKVRWCSAYLKIDVCAMAIANQDRFIGKRLLILSGERAEESPQRAKYRAFEPDRSHSGRRHVDRFRPVHTWSEAEVWEIIKQHRINPHPAYHLGWSRLSCMTCIFGSADQWATIRAIAPHKFERIAQYEEDFGVTIQRTDSVRDLANLGRSYPNGNVDLIKPSLSYDYHGPIFMEDWVLPAGAYKANHGPS